MKLLIKQLIKSLTNINGYPRVSILLRTHTTLHGYQSDRIRIKNLISEAESRLRRLTSLRETRRLVRRLNRLTERIDFRYLDKGLCIFVSSDAEAVLHLTREIEDRVVIGDRFALKDLLIEMENGMDALMLVLCSDRARLLSNPNGVLTEAHGESDFPMLREDCPGATERVISSTLANNAWFPGRRRGPVGRAPLPGAYIAEENSVQQEHSRQFFRKVDEALASIIQPETKLILCGAPHQSTLFEDICVNAERIIARVDGNFMKHNLGELKTIFDEQIEQFRRAQTEQALESMVTHNDLAELAFGMEEVWQRAQQKPIDTLIIEDQFRFPALADREHLIIEESSKGEPDRIDDATDELVQLAYNAGAKIFLCRKDELEHYGRIAARFSY